jgi:hypothetical protein
MVNDMVVRIRCIGKVRVSRTFWYDSTKLRASGHKCIRRTESGLVINAALEGIVRIEK